MKQINTRTEKKNFLNMLKQGKATVCELLPYKLELWTQYIDDPDIFINEKRVQKLQVQRWKRKKPIKGIMLFS